MVRYCAATGQASLPAHSDQSHFSLTLALNARGEYAGGGTAFEDWPAEGEAVAPDVGHCVLFPGECVHSGAPVTAGVRYIVAAFLWVEAEAEGGEAGAGGETLLA